MATFNFTFDPGTTVQQMLGMEMAGRIWDRYLTDNVTLNIHVGVTGGLASNVIGGALPGMRASQSYQTYRNALNSGPKSADDNTALSSLPNATTYTTSYAYLQNAELVHKTENRSTLNMTRAVAKASGLAVTDGSTALDGYILFSNLTNATANGQTVRWSYDYTRSSTQATNSLDFLSTAIHEIGHILGFVSGVDQPGLYGMMTDYNSTQETSSTQAYQDSMSNRLQYINPLDLFRYSAPGVRNMSHGEQHGPQGYDPKYFSLNGGTTNIVNFSSGMDTANEGDGYQASHWKNGTNAIMNPTLSLNSRRNIAALDLRAMDVIGWDIASTGINTTIALSDLQTQSRQALATRSGQSTTWITNNLTASPTALVANRDQMIYSMMQNSVVYDMTRVPPPSSTGGIISRQTLAQVFQQRSLFSTVDELDGWVSEALPEVDITGLGPAGADLSALNGGEALPVMSSTADLETVSLETVSAVSVVEPLALPMFSSRQFWVEAIASPTAASQPVAIALDQPMTLNSDDAGFSFIPYPTQTLNYGGGILNSQQTGVQSDEMGDRPFSLNDLTLDPTLLAGIAAL
jgi:hypothetical protein